MHPAIRISGEEREREGEGEREREKEGGKKFLITIFGITY